MSARARPDLFGIWSSLPRPYGPGTCHVPCYMVSTAVMAVMHQKAATTTNSSDTHNTRPAYPRNRKSSSAASTLSWQGPHTSGCLNDFNFCMPKNVALGLRAPKYIIPPHILQLAVSSHKFPAPTAELPRNITISPFHSRPAAPSATSARETSQFPSSHAINMQTQGWKRSWKPSILDQPTIPTLKTQKITGGEEFLLGDSR